MSSEDVEILSDEQLKTLAKLLLYQEQHRIMSIPFRSEKERGEYLRECLEAYKLAMNLIDRPANLEKQMDDSGHNDSSTPATPRKPVSLAAVDDNENKGIVEEYKDYIEFAVGAALRFVKNYHVRHDYLKKIRAHAETLEPDVNRISGGAAEAKAKAASASQQKAEAQARKAAFEKKAADLNAEAEAAEAAGNETEAKEKRAAQAEAETEANKAATVETEAAANEAAQTKKLAKLEEEGRELIKNLVDNKETQKQFMLKRKTPCGRNFSKGHDFWEKGTASCTFEDMVKKYQRKLVKEKGSAYDGIFEELDDGKKIEVFDEIVKTSGRGSMIMNRLLYVVDKAGKALILLAIGLVVLDIYYSKHKLRTALVEGGELAVGLAAGYAGEVIGTAVATSVLGAVGVAAGLTSSIILCATGLGVGLLFGILAGVAVSWLVNKFINTGSEKHEISYDDGLTLHYGSIHVFAAPMPNGDLLARQLAYVGSKDDNKGRNQGQGGSAAAMASPNASGIMKVC